MKGGGGGGGNKAQARRDAHHWLAAHGFDSGWAANMVNGPWKNNPWNMARNHYNAHVAQYGMTPVEEKRAREAEAAAQRARQAALNIPKPVETKDIKGTLAKSGAQQGFRSGANAMDRKRKRKNLVADDLKIAMNIAGTEALGINLA